MLTTTLRLKRPSTGCFDKTHSVSLVSPSLATADVDGQ